MERRTQGTSDSDDSSSAAGPAEVSEIKPQPAARTADLAVAALGLGVLAFCAIFRVLQVRSLGIPALQLVYALPGVAGCVVGLAALRRIKRSEGRLTGEATATVGLLASTLSLTVLAAVLALTAALRP